MKRVLLVLMLVLFGVGARAAWAADAGEGERQRNATGDVIAAIKTTDSTAFRLKGDGTSLYAVDPSAPPWGQPVYMNALNDTISLGASPFQGDSTPVYAFAAAGHRRCAVWLEVKPTSADTGNIYLAAQARACITSAVDSNSVAYISQWRPLGDDGSTTMDTLLVYGSNAVPWEGEIPVEFSSGRAFGGGDPRSTALSPYGAWPRMRWLPLVDGRGQWIEAPYIQFKFRGLYTGPAKAVASKPRIIVHVVFWS